MSEMDDAYEISAENRVCQLRKYASYDRKNVHAIRDAALVAEDYGKAIWAGVLPLRSTFTKLRPDDRLLPSVEPSAVIKSLEGRTL